MNFLISTDGAFFGNMTESNANVQSSPICKYNSALDGMNVKLSALNSNNCSGAGVNFIRITNNLDCEGAHDKLNGQGLVASPGYKGYLSNISTPSGCLLSGAGEVYFNYDPVGNANSLERPICKYVGKSNLWQAQIMCKI